MADLKAMAQAVERGDRDAAVQAVKDVLAEGLKPEQILNDGLIAAMSSIGEKFKKNEVFIPEVLIAARAMAGAMEVLEPKLVETGVEPRGKVVVGTVKQDLHDIGKNLVAMMLKGGGFKVIDLGVDVDPQKFVDAAKDEQAQIIALSALLTTTMPNMKEVVLAMRKDGLKGVKVIIGGAPVTQAYADEIGADGYAADAGSAVDLAKGLVDGK
ncbi:MAG TPA: corrinoid protein [Phycisphaerae bacterium]|nr:corrinoid protein [Phycisphaerae bacterium]